MPPNASPAPTATPKRTMATAGTSPATKKQRTEEGTYFVPRADEMVQYELIPRKRLNQVLGNWDFFMSYFTKPEHCKNHKNIHKGLMRTMSLLKGDVLRVKYTTGVDGGRLVSKPFYSIQNMPRPIRHFICRGIYHDVDIECAAATFFSQYGEERGFHTAALKCYVANCKQMRHDLAEALLPRIEGGNLVERSAKALENAKGYVTKVLMGGHVDKEVTRVLGDGERNWVAFIRNECQVIGTSLEAARPDLWELAKDKAGEEGFNIPGKAAARLYYEWEADVLRIMVAAAKERGLLKVKPEEVEAFGGCYELTKATSICALIHDGFQVPYKGCEFPKEEMRLLEETVFEKTTYRIRLKEKSFDEGPEMDDEDLDEEEIGGGGEGGAMPERVFVTRGDREAAMIFLERIKDEALDCQGETWVRHRGIWTSKEAVVRKWFIRRLMASNIWKHNSDGKEVCMTDDIAHTNKVIQVVKAHLPDVDNFMELVRESTRGKLLFKDGYWDFAEECFVEGFDGVVGVVHINRPFPRMEPEVYEAHLAELKRRVIYPIWGRENTDQGKEWEVLRLYLIRALAGHVEDKLWAVGQGLRNSGKGVLMQLLLRGFEGYVASIGSNNFLTRGSDMGGDEAKKMSWAKILNYVRLCVTSEMRQVTGGKPSVIDGDMMKSLSNGGEDPMIIRTNHVDEFEIYVSCLFLLLANDLPDISPADACETMIAFKFNRKFIPKNEFEEKFGEGGTSFKYSIADDTIKAFCRKREVLDTFVLYLIKGYQGGGKVVPTEGMIANKSDLQPETVDDQLGAYFEFTGRPTDYTAVKVIKTKLAEHRLGMNYPAFKTLADERNAGMVVPDPTGKKRCPGAGSHPVAVLYGVKYISPDPSPRSESTSGATGTWVGPQTAVEARLRGD
jgi:hypothetical protein